MKTEKTAKEWFEQLPEPIRTQAIEAWEKSDWNTKNYLCESLVDALNNWEWDDYWGDVFNRFVKGEFDTPNLHGWIPVGERLPTVEDADENENVLTLNIRNEIEIKYHRIVSKSLIQFWQPLPKLPEVRNETIKLSDGRSVSKHDYITAKTKILVEFGYSSLVEEEVTEQLDIILKGGTPDVIGFFIKDDLDLGVQNENN